MIKITYGDRFLRAAARLEKAEQEKLGRLLELLRENPYHPKLHTKPLSGHLSGLFSFRINRDFRVIFKFGGPEEANLLEVGHRREIYR